MRASTLLTALLFAIAGCTRPSSSGGSSTPTVEPVAAPVVLVYGDDRPAHDLEPMLDALAKREVVLVGETHLDDNTHRIERAILEGLARRKPGKVVLALEMFQRDVQGVLDDYLAGKIDEATFLETSKPWNNYRTGYRPMIELAKAEGIPVVAANLPAQLQQAFAMKGAEAMQSLDEKQRAWLPPEIHPPDEAYWERIGRRLRDRFHGHDQDAGPDARKYAVQNLWDNAMAHAAVEALQAEPGRTVMLVAGAFHVEYGQGIANQIRQRRPKASVATVTVHPTHDLDGVDPTRDADRADYVVYTPARARGPDDGVFSVIVPQRLQFRLHVPDGATEKEPAPLLVWLDDDGTSVADAQRYWTIALGVAAAVATIEPPHTDPTDDLRPAGRWSWPQSREDDHAAVAVGLEQLLDYVGDRYPIDPARIVVAGRGAGATMAAWAALYGELPATVVAWDPTHTGHIVERGLPEQSPPTRGLVLVGDDEALVKTLRASGMPSPKTQPAPAADQRRHVLEDELRKALGLAPIAWPDEAVTLAIAHDTTVGRQWAEQHARLREAAGVSATVVAGSPKGAHRLEVAPADFADGRALPVAPGSFGGTTVLVLPPGLSKPARDAWTALERDDVMRKRSRFATLRVTDDAKLPAVLDELRAQHKSTVLVAPAVFVAPPTRMQALRAATQGHDAGLQLHWLPGLGGELARARAEQSDPSAR